MLPFPCLTFVNHLLVWSHVSATSCECSFVSRLINKNNRLALLYSAQISINKNSYAFSIFECKCNGKSEWL